MPSAEKLAGFVAWCRQHLDGDGKGEAQIFRDHLFHAFDWAGGLKEAGAALEIRTANAAGAGVAVFACPSNVGGVSVVTVFAL